MAMFCGIDWAEGHHDIALIDGDGTLVAKRRIEESLDGVAEFTAMLAAAGDSARGADPGGDRDTARATGRGAARDRSTDLPDQPAGRGPLSGTHLGVGQEERSRRCDGVGEHPAHRSAPAPDAARRLVAGPLDHGAGPRLSGRGVAAHQAGAGAAGPAAGVLPRVPGRVRRRLAAGRGVHVPSWPVRMPGRCWRSRPARPRA